ncbi:MAG: acetyl-CoA carboxylase carboxyltransferase subunit alpha [Bdellovibrionales bacterium]|nr:acetyl-CoA carboxylase carboxyltransferase subunit alpha [Bdellovibrionales bacterium]
MNLKTDTESASTETTSYEVAPSSERIKKAWSVVEKSRHPQRPHAIDYLHKLFSEFEEFKGDRTFADDSALISGAGILRNSENEAGLKVFFLAHEKGRNTKQKIERNFGMARPEGYRKTVRMMELAERFNRPILTLIDTPGAFPGIGAEERGQSEAIASSILKMLEVKVPTVGAVIGEGGSGGALAIGVADTLMMLENSVYSVISPESCAAILWGSAAESKQAAAALKMTARETFDLGICDEVIPEEGEGAHVNPDFTTKMLLDRVNWHFKRLLAMKPEKRMEARYKKFRFIDAKHVG